MTAKSPRTSRERRQSAKKRQANRVGMWLIGGSALLVLIVIAVIARSQSSPSLDLEKYAELPADWIDRTFLGSPDAPVTIETWEDYRCPACAQWARDIKPRVMEEYVASGDVRLSFRHFPLGMHEPGASMAAMASECAADQGGFWPYHDRLFAATNANSNTFGLEQLLGFANDLDLDRSALSGCMNALEHRDEVQQSVAEATARGYSSTPTIVINGVPMNNPFDYNELTATVDAIVGTSQ